MTDLIGQTLGNYQITSVIGEGGMGTVYLGEHRTLRRKAAVKVLKRQFAADANMVKRFVEEARAASAVAHPNIVDIHDVGTLVDGLPFMLMEYLAGESLGRRLARVGRLSPSEARSIVIQASSALEAVHDRGVVHRDLKPDNLFLVPDSLVPGGERVKVLDFGVAKLRGDLSGGGVQTRSGTLLGTPHYMSPEQCRGLNDLIDSRTDIYALGVILYEMLCGETPFQAPSVRRPGGPAPHHAAPSAHGQGAGHAARDGTGDLAGAREVARRSLPDHGGLSPRAGDHLGGDDGGRPGAGGAAGPAIARPHRPRCRRRRPCREPRARPCGCRSTAGRRS